MGYKRAAFAIFCVFFFLFICVGQDLDGHQASAGVGAYQGGICDRRSLGVRWASSTPGFDVRFFGGYQVMSTWRGSSGYDRYGVLSSRGGGDVLWLRSVFGLAQILTFIIPPSKVGNTDLSPSSFRYGCLLLGHGPLIFTLRLVQKRRVLLHRRRNKPP